MVRRSHRDGPGSANQAPRDRDRGTNGATDVPAVGQRGGTQGPGPGPVTAWPVMAGGGVWVCSVTLTWFLLVWKETQEPGLRLVTARRVTTWSGDWSATALTWFHEWAGGVFTNGCVNVCVVQQMTWTTFFQLINIEVTSLCEMLTAFFS